MTKYNQILFVFEDTDTADRACEIWNSLQDASYSDWREDQLGTWDPLGTVHLKTAARKSDKAESWAVPEGCSYVQLLYDIDRFIDATVHDDDDKLRRYVAGVQDLAARSYEALSVTPVVGFGPSGSHLEQLAGGELPLPVTGSDIEAGCISYTCWLMVFPPALVERFGRDTLDEATLHARRELADGAVMTVAYENPISAGQTHQFDRQLGLDPPRVDDEDLAY